MTGFLDTKFDPDDPLSISLTDELSLWSAPFGLDLLRTVAVRTNLTALDVGSGLGFPMIELAERLGMGSRVYGLDPWSAAIARARKKIQFYGLTNVVVVEGRAERMPFGNDFFDLIVSNNGITNVEDIPRALSECRRVCKPGAQFVMTYNLNGTMRELYAVIEDVFRKERVTGGDIRIKEHIDRKRPPLELMRSLLHDAGFDVHREEEKSFHMDFAGAAAIFHHHLIRFWFLPAWKELVAEAQRSSVFTSIMTHVDEITARDGYFTLTVPYVILDCVAR